MVLPNALRVRQLTQMEESLFQLRTNRSKPEKLQYRIKQYLELLWNLIDIWYLLQQKTDDHI